MMIIVTDGGGCDDNCERKVISSWNLVSEWIFLSEDTKENFTSKPTSQHFVSISSSQLGFLH